MVIDHTSYAVSETEGDHTLIASDNFIESNVILGSKKIEASALALSMLEFGIQLDLMHIFGTLLFRCHMCCL